MKSICNNEIWYKTTDGCVLKNFNASAFDSMLMSNTYECGQGVLRFDTDLTIIGESAFELCEELESVILPNSIVRIDVGAFSVCVNLKDIQIPLSVTEIGDCAFGLCVSMQSFSGKFASADGLCLIIDGVLKQFALGCELEEYSIPTEAVEIGWSSFSESQLTKIILHDKINKICHSAFCGCDKLVDINIPNSVKSIEDSAFQDCANLKKINIPQTVSNVGINVFDGCGDIIISHEDSMGDETKELLTILSEYNLVCNTPKDGWVYSGDKSIKSINIPLGVSTISANAFEDCHLVEEIIIPNSVSVIEDGAFCNLNNLHKFMGKFASADGRCLIINNILVGFAPKDIKKYHLPQGIKAIAPMTFMSNEALESICIPNGVRSIGYQAFWDCVELCEVEFPNSLVIIGDSAFECCSSLTHIVLPNTVRMIGSSAFSDCSNLAEATLPNTLIKTHDSIFSECHKLTRINSRLMTEDGRCLIVEQSLINYIETSPINEYTIPNGVTSIASSAFYRNKNITKIVIPRTVTQIGACAFWGCKNLCAVEFESSTPPKIERTAFYEHAHRFAFYVPDGAESDYYAVLKKEGLDVLVLSKTKGENAFHDIIYGDSFDSKISIQNLLCIGMDCLHRGDNNGATAIFEKLIAKGYKDDYPYKALIGIYKRQNDIDNELRILTIALTKLPNRGNSHYEYQKRIDRLTSASSQAIPPSKADIPTVKEKHGDIFEELIMRLPEFNFYAEGVKNTDSASTAHIEEVWAIQRYFKKLIQEADLANTRKDYKTAANIYEQIVYENYWMPTPCDKLIKLYSKSAALRDEELRVLEYGIKHFSQLRQKRLDYVKMLAQKYNAVEFLNERLASGGKITYYSGVFELYNPFPIVEKWKERLMKKYKKQI